MVDRMASAYALCGAKKSELVLVGRRGLQSSINRFDFLSSYRFSAYAKMWVKQRLLEVVTKRVNRNSLVLSDADNADNTTKFKKLSLDYCADGTNLHDVVAADSDPSQAADVEDFDGDDWDSEEGEMEEEERRRRVRKKCAFH
ncbi:MAG: hypothetical protein ACKFI0_00500 [Candidatus Hodgkinia cicadicola]